MELPSTKRFVTASATRLAVAGAAAGLVEGLAALGRDSAALPSGKPALVAMLGLLYGGTLGLAGALVGLVLALWARASDGGGLVAAAFSAESRATRRPGWAYLVAGLPLVAALQPTLALFCRDALVRYHHRGLIAALVAVFAVGMALLAVLLLPLVAATLGLVARRARVEIARTTPGGVALLVWAVGLVILAVGLAAYLWRLQSGPQRMAPPVRAAQFAWVATIAIAVVTPVLGSLARLLGRKLEAPGWRSPQLAVGATAALLVVVIAAASAWGWSTVKQLDFRPFTALAVVLGALALLSLGRSAGPPPRTRTAVLVSSLLVVALCFGLGLRLGNRPLLRRVATAQTGLFPLLARGLQLVSDRDRDGYAALLGGGDCDDSDPSVHPGAFDWPDDGVDQDCNGHQATLQNRKPRAHAELPSGQPTDLNVLLITIDALRADHVSSYGYARKTTPILDELAASGARFANSWSHAPSTRYSIPAIITGRYPSTIAVGSSNWPPNVLPENRLVAEMLHDLGYYTGGTFTYHYFGHGWGLNQGFDEYDFSLQTLHSMGGDPAKTRGTSAAQLTEKNLAFLERNAGKKFFLWTHYYDTHFQFEPHPEAPETNFGTKELDLYDGEIRFTDLQLGRLFAKLRELGLWDKTIIIVTADHGEGFGEHGIPPNRRHGYHLYRTETKVPLIIRVPGLAPRVVTTAASHVDIVPTLLDLLGRPASDEPQLLGDSLLGPMLGAELGDRKIFQEVWYEGPTSKKAVVSSRWHYIRNLVPEDTRELYDLTADPDEDHDRQGAPDEAELDGALAAWMDAIAIPGDFAKKVEGAVSTQPIAPPQKLGDAFGDWLVLDGVEVVTPSVKPGATAQVDLVWHVKQRAPAEWRIFTHFTAASGQRLNADHQPVEGLLPLQQVRPGTYLRDRVKVAVPPGFPTGTMRVLVGLWRPNERAPVRGSHGRDNAVEVATIEVAP